MTTAQAAVQAYREMAARLRRSAIDHRTHNRPLHARKTRYWAKWLNDHVIPGEEVDPKPITEDLRR